MDEAKLAILRQVAAALVAALAGGAWWWLGGRNGPASPKPVSTPKPIPPKAGPTDTDVKAIAVDAGTQEELIKGIDDVQGYFKECKDKLAKTSPSEKKTAMISAGRRRLPQSINRPKIDICDL